MSTLQLLEGSNSRAQELIDTAAATTTAAAMGPDGLAAASEDVSSAVSPPAGESSKVSSSGDDATATTTTPQPQTPQTPPSPPALVYHLTKKAGIQTRHLVVYNTGPAVGVDELTLRRVFEAYGEVERVYCPNPAAARVLISFHEVCVSEAFSTKPDCTHAVAVAAAAVAQRSECSVFGLQDVGLCVYSDHGRELYRLLLTVTYRAVRAKLHSTTLFPALHYNPCMHSSRRMILNRFCSRKRCSMRSRD